MENSKYWSFFLHSVFWRKIHELLNIFDFPCNLISLNKAFYFFSGPIWIGKGLMEPFLKPLNMIPTKKNPWRTQDYLKYFTQVTREYPVKIHLLTR